ncbi:hypothetical protein J6590_086550 [Homalodisca vitripennis]|nr:hypothetical protein J6590_086550 [Homalodisca vitripennis]
MSFNSGIIYIPGDKAVNQSTQRRNSTIPLRYPRSNKSFTTNCWGTTSGISFCKELSEETVEK